MQAPLETLRQLHESGMLHRRLLTRIRILTVIGLILLAIAVYDLIKDRLSFMLFILIIVLGFVLGLFVFSRMSRVVWHEEEEIISAGRLDVTAGVIIVLYIIFDIGLRQFLHAKLDGISMVTGYVFSALGATLIGRSVGTRIAIYRLLERQRAVRKT